MVDELTSEPLVPPYSLDKEVALTTDASEKIISAVLTQNDHPVIYISRNLTSAEKTYSNIEREALAVIFAVTRLRQFLLERKFILRTDHKPLQYIFNPSNQIPKVVSTRLARWAITLMAYDYDVQYTPGKDIGHADAMSRLRFKDYEDDLVAVAMATFEKPMIDAEKLRKEMLSNEFTKRMMNRIRTVDWKNCTTKEKSFINVSNALTVQNDLIYNGLRVFIPITCRKQVIEKFHDVHQGINALINLVKILRGGHLWIAILNNLLKSVSNAANTDQDRSILPTNGKNALRGKDCIWTGFMKQNTVTF